MHSGVDWGNQREAELRRSGTREGHKVAPLRHMCEGPGSTRHRGPYPHREPKSSRFSDLTR